MAVNPLYRNEYYFFSGMYDDSLITDFYRKISAESYDQAINYQHNMLGRKRFLNSDAILCKSTLGEFKVDDKYNSLVGLPSGSLTLKVKDILIPVNDKRKYLSTYGIRYKKIHLLDFYKRNDIFDKTITLQIGSYRILEAYLIQNIDNDITLAIANSTTDGIPSANFNKIIAEYGKNEPVWLFSSELTKTYFADTTTAAVISSSATDGYYDVTIPKSASLNNIGARVNHEHGNSWDCLISFNAVKFGKKILVSTHCFLKTSTEDYNVFSVNESFIKTVTANNNGFNIFFINRPNRKHILLYEYSKESSPILNLSYTYNPSGNINVEVYEINTSTMCRGRRLYDPEFSQIYFPNIFDFSTLNVNNSDLIIEITEYSPTYTNQVMNNSIKPLIDSLTPEYYTEYVVNGYDKAADGTPINLKEFSPKHFPTSVDDYLNSEYFGNYRGYILDKIEKTISTDPYLLVQYYEWMSNINNKVISTSGTPKTFRLGTEKNGEFGNSGPVVMNTSVASVLSDDVLHFSEKHTYFTYYTEMTKSPAMVYINGKYIKPTCYRYYRGLNYLFFPIRVINEEMSIYKTSAELRAASPITVDVYPQASISLAEAPKDTVVIDSMERSFSLFDQLENPLFSLNELIVYDEFSGTYVGNLLDVFDINLEASEFAIKHPTATENVVVSNGATTEYLMTLLNEVYTTKDNTPIIIRVGGTTLSLTNMVESLISEGYITEEERNCISNKKLNFRDVTLTPKDERLLGMTISVVSKEFSQSCPVNSDRGIYDPTTNTTSFTLTCFNVDPNMNSYFVFVDGKLVHSAELTEIDSKLNGDLKLTLAGNMVDENSIIIVEHIPMKYHREEFFATSWALYMKPADVTKTEFSEIWPVTSDDGLVLQSRSGRIYNNYPFSSAQNPKFTASGLRLPPYSETTNRLYAQYYDADRAATIDVNPADLGYVYMVDCDEPITKLAKQNPYSDDCDHSLPMNPLDILSYEEPVIYLASSDNYLLADVDQLLLAVPGK